MAAALVIIDVQNAIAQGFATPERQPLNDAALDSLVVRLQSVRDRAQEAHWPIFIIQHDDPEGDRLARGSEGWQIRPELRPSGTDILVNKRSCDSFFDTDLETHLRRLGIDHLVIGGCMTQFCVDTTCRRAVSLGFEVTLIGDGHGTADLGDLHFDQIIRHHNRVLDGFAAGLHRITVRPADAIAF